MRPSPALLQRLLWRRSFHRCGLQQQCHTPSTVHAAAAPQAACHSVQAAPTAWPDLKRDGTPRSITRLPQGMSLFQSSRAAGVGAATSEVAASTSADAEAMPQAISDAPPPSASATSICISTSPARSSLPPWPVDAFEFNALAAHGGHDLRLASGDIPFHFNVHLAPSSLSLSSPADSTATPSLTPELTAYLLMGMGCAMPLSPPTTSTAASSASLPPPQSAGAKTSLLTLDTIRQLQAAEEAPAAQAALRDGGWVCAQCWSVVTTDRSERDDPKEAAAEHTVPLPRTVCPTCRTLRHDAHALSTVLALRRQADLWKCGGCGEVNPRAALPCRCCAASQDNAAEADVGDLVNRLTLTEEAAGRPVGAVVVTRNRIARWRCPACNEMNSLQQASCRYCERERFELTVLCPSCETPRTLSNALAYAGVESSVTGTATDGAEAATTTAATAASSSAAARRRYPERLFDAANCYAPHTPHLHCLHCHGPLHGGRVAWVSGGGPWWCACGVVNAASAYSCVRCRLPRVVEDASALRRLLARPLPCDDDGGADGVPGSRSIASASAADGSEAWDFEGCTNWMCDGCGGVNMASHQIVVEVKVSRTTTDSTAATATATPPPPSSQKTVRRMKTLHGASACRHCGAPWHHQVLRDGELWRCACHALNGRHDAQCTSCGLPALDGMRPDMLAAWTRGDWRCPSCGILCYRTRQRCACGAARPATQPAAEV